MSKPESIQQWAWDEAIATRFRLNEKNVHPLILVREQDQLERYARALQSAYERGKREQRNPNLDEAERQAIRTQEPSQ